MSKKLMKDSEFEKISGGNFKKFNRGLEYTTAGIGCAAGLAAVGYCAFNAIDKIKNPRKSGGWLNLRGMFDPIINIAGVVGAVVAIDSTRRIVSQAKDLY
ncbi:MAG: hypothetical protein IJQ10_04085 [Clostridia bacterium]|nr:hypothetical protein [Clostridia bacterium]